MGRKKPHPRNQTTKENRCRRPISPKWPADRTGRLWAWIEAGELPLSVGMAFQVQREQEKCFAPWPPPALLPFLEGLRKLGVDTGRILLILREKAQPNVISVRLMGERYAKAFQQRRKAIVALSRSYAGLDRRILKDVALSDALKRAWSREYDDIKRDLRSLKGEAPLAAYLTKEDGYTVGPEKDLSRHHFWTPVVVSLVEEWKQVGLMKHQAFKDIAHLLSLTFPPFPDNPDLVKQRYHRARKR